MKLLLSPAKSISLNIPNNSLKYSYPQFGKETATLIKKLKQLSPKKIAELMSVSQDLAELNFERFQNFVLPGEESECLLPAIFAFSGEVYKGFEAESLSEEQLNRAQNQLRILSGLYGILKPLDLIYPYRLEMGTKFPNNKEYKNLYTFWGSKICKTLQKELQESEPIVNLASTEYSKAVEFKKIKNPVVTPLFKEFKNGEYKTIMMYAKHARGAMARYIISENINDIESLKSFSLDGYSFDEISSNDSVFTFLR